MAKAGRNAPCPCGSGKKYKKCCLQKDQERSPSMSTTAPPSAGRSPETAANVLSQLSPYVVAKIFESSDEFARLKRRNPTKASLFWTPGRVASLETEEILARLRELGIDPSREVYLELARNRTCAWDLSGLWRQKIGTRLPRHEKDFLGVAACELWKRYCPERPSVEMLDDWMQEGYSLVMDGQGAQACDRWSTVWKIIHSRFGSQMRTCDPAAVVFDGTQGLYNWVQDFALELHNAALHDVRYAEMGIGLCQAVLAQFPDEDELFHVNFRADLGEFYYLADRAKEGERVLLGLIRNYPDHAAGYARFAEILAYGARRDDVPPDPPRAQALLESALARPVSNAADYDLQKRLDELRNPRKDAAGQDPQILP